MVGYTQKNEESLVQQCIQRLKETDPTKRDRLGTLQDELRKVK